MTIRHAIGVFSRARVALGMAVGVGLALHATSALATKVFVFNATPLGDYSVSRDATNLPGVTASPSGVVPVADATTTPSRYTLRYLGVTPAPPGKPSNLSAVGDDRGCARLQWRSLPADDFVDSYRIYAAPTGSAWSDSFDVDLFRIARTGASSWFVACGYAAGSWTFAVRAHNQFGLFGQISSPASTQITNGNASGPQPPRSLAASEPSFGCLQLAWSPPGDPTVVGYRMYIGTHAGVYSDSVDAGGNNSAQMCGLPAGTWYVSARSFNDAQVLSAFAPAVSINLAGVDAAPPVVSGLTPVSGATSVARNTAVGFDCADAKSGVDSTSIRVTIDGVAAASVMITGSPASYMVQARATQVLPARSLVVVVVDADDRAQPPNSVRSSWSFTTGDSVVVDASPPLLSWVSPRPGAEVTAGTPLVASVRDDGSGVNLSTLAFSVNGSTVSPERTGNSAAVTLTYIVPSGLPPGGDLVVDVTACDLAGNCAQNLSARFSTEAARFAALGEGAIVPNGYWSGDPDRPLEVRNLPSRWTVYIFNTAGELVRRFRDPSGASGNWIWDFTNDAGRRVAAALYLVRVVDPAGSVRSAGRFVVQGGR